MILRRILRILLAGSATFSALAGEPPLKISVVEYRDKVYASWLGQCVGNMYGLPHENRYIATPGPDNMPYGYKDQKRIREANGAFSDDDTDLEYMYLHAMEEFGPEPTYKQLARRWRHHIRDRIWVANRSALAAMHYGFTPPFTGRKPHNQHWFQIDPQLVNEIWAVTAPGMIRYAAEKSLWAAQITDEDWGVEPTVHYGAMYAAAFFEKDIEKLIDVGTRSLRSGSRFARTVEDMKSLYRKYPNDWKQARKEMAEKYFDGELAETRTIINANLNGAAGILALLYGHGSFQHTLDLACAIGFDADNQAATMSGLLGVVLGTGGLPQDALFPFPELNWKEPLNDIYKNVSRHDMPDGSLKDIAMRMARQGEKIIFAHGGKRITENGQDFYVINPQATFIPPFEIPVGPSPRLEAGKPVDHRFLAMHGPAPVSWRVAAGSLPDGITFRDGSPSGVARAAGIFPITIAAQTGRRTDELAVTLVVRSENLARAATEVLVPSLSAARERIVSLRPGAAKELYSADPEVLRDGKTFGSNSAFLGAMPPGQPTRALYGYRWTGSQEIGLVSFHTATGDDAAWFRTLAVEYENETGAWKKIDRVVVSPELPAGDNSLDKAYGVEYLLAFPPVRTKAIRIAGETSAPSGRSARSTSISELGAYGPLAGYTKLPQRLGTRP